MDDRPEDITSPPDDTPSDEPVEETPADDNSNPPLEVDKERVLALLRQGEIEGSYGRLRWSSNYTTIVTVHDDELETLAVYKPCRGERPLWDFPEGTLYKREVAAYIVSEELEWELVSPTVIRETGPMGTGSLQLFVEHDPEVTYFNLDESFLPQLQYMAAFDYLTNNADRKGGHCLVDPRDKLWGIDHGICFNARHKLRTVIWDFAGQPIPDHILNAIETFYEKLESGGCAFYQTIRELLNPSEITALQKRTRQLLTRKVYPQPGPGPNYPWPPI